MNYDELSTRVKNALLEVSVVDRKSAWEWIKNNDTSGSLGVHRFLYLRPIGKKSMNEIVEWLGTDESDNKTELAIIAVALREIAYNLKRIANAKQASQ